MVTIFQSELIRNKINSEKIKVKIMRAMDLLDIRGSELSIALDEDKTLKELNNKYLSIDESTDVLSFYSGIENPETGNKFLGDIIISNEKVISQAKNNNHPYEKEFLILVIHGLLHLLGYDHEDPDDTDKMFTKQNELISELVEN